MAPGQSGSIDGKRIVRSYPYGGTGDSRYVTEDGSVWQSVPNSDVQYPGQDPPTGVTVRTIRY